MTIEIDNEQFDPKIWVNIDGEWYKREDLPIEYQKERFDNYLNEIKTNGQED